MIPFMRHLPSPRECSARVATLAMLLLLGAASAQALPHSRVEEFDTEAYWDEDFTTAFWDAGTGKLHLHTFFPSERGFYNTPDIALDVAIAGTVAYVADRQSGLQIINIANPASPTLIGSYDTPDEAYGVAISGTRAYVADNLGGLQIIDVSNPASPTLLGSYDTAGNCFGVAVVGKIAYVADQAAGLQIIDVSNPASPALIGSYDTSGSVMNVFVSGGVAYVADSNGGLLILNVANPASPTLIGTYSTPGPAMDVAVVGTTAYVAAFDSGLQILNVSNPASPTLIGSLNTPGNAQGVAVEGNRVCIGDDLGGLQIIDVSNPSSPTSVLGQSMGDIVRGVAISGNEVYVPVGSLGLKVHKLYDRVGPNLLGTYDTPGYASRVVVAGKKAYVADVGTLLILDVSNPASPVLLGSYDSPGNIFDVEVLGTRAYLAAGTSGLEIVDVSNPASPTLLGSYNTPGDAYAVAVAGTVAYIADIDLVVILDVSNPASPTLLANYDTPDINQDVAVSGTRAYVTTDLSGLIIIDVSNPSLPTTLGSYVTTGSAGVAVEGTVAYVASSSFGLRIFNVSNPASPALLGTCPMPGNAFFVTISGGAAYVGNDAWGLQIVDISNPASPVLGGSYNTPGFSHGIAVSGHVAYVTDNTSGLQLIEVGQNRFNLPNNVGQSLPFDASSDVIRKARISSTQVNNVTWELSANGGTNWQAATPGAGWFSISTPGADLRWRATLEPTTPHLTAAAPEASRVQIDWLYDFPIVDAVADIGNDQGRQVRLDWTRNAKDFVGASPQVTEYAIYRRIDAGFAPMARGGRGRDGALSAEDAEALAAGWDFVTTVPASAEEEYSVVVPTLADSSIADGQHWTAFKVRARTATPGVYYESYPDSGYSKDNVSPAMPAPFAGVFSGGPSQLHWGANHEADFDHYALHRGGTADFAPGQGTLVATPPDTGYVDTGSSWAYYKLAAVDVNGNTSGYALVTPAASSSGNTPPGSNVSVAVSPLVQMTYQNVSSGGQSQVTMQTSGPVPPNGLKVAPGAPPIYYRITSTASFTGTITICVTYDPDFLSGPEHKLKLMHYDTALTPDQWVQVQTSRDTAANIICGVVSHLSEFALMEMDETVGVEDENPSAPQLLSCAPNPVTGRARIEYVLASTSAVRLGLYDLQGRRIRELESRAAADPGKHVVEWDGRGARGERLRAGVYFLWLEAGGTRQMRRVVVTR